MIQCTKRKEGLIGRSWIVQPQSLPDRVILDRLDLSDLTSRPSDVYVEVPPQQTLVHQESAFSPFFVCTAVDGAYMTEVSKLQVAPIYMAREKIGSESCECGMGFDVEIVCPDCSEPVPARVSIFFSYTPQISRHEKLATALHDQAPVSFDDLKKILQDRVRGYITEGFASSIGNRRLTLEQIDDLISGDGGSDVRGRILTNIEQLAILYGLRIECGNFSRKDIFDRIGSTAWTQYAAARSNKLHHEISIKTIQDDSNYIKAINEGKMIIEQSDRELAESRKIGK